MHIPVTPSMRLDGRRALVTGAGRGLGLAAASALAAAGAEVVLAARSPQEVNESAAAIREAGGTASGVALDVVDLDATSAWLEQTPAFDILVNNAGTNRPAAFLDTEVGDYDFVFDVNVRAAFFIAQGVARKLVREGRPGSIINVSSQMGHVGATRRTVYCATKHAVEGMTKAMAAELGANGIRVNTLCPTFIETPMTKPFFDDRAFRDAVLNKLKLGRVGIPEDIMGAVVFLASDASALMTGSALMLDSGWTSTS
ncbi:MAG: Gluconate 5-dehydrogenase (EC [uncultured Paraburkholderia sp.]|uniref:SDR family NAD(P)-dependent oxidoreductase n=1 Tax=uncultured Paraburkholderia sp. TaxID=1822466 RepID=UPI002598E0EF|nr:SDR family oxidoreductase [uncultured Paraburkholderia sp.]CAH2894451.1 MAG: Gluconate 5-dehydrogenase (EC [uncultured Paraburkholderia sp.]CAH2910874.1 MAG: Gluconate 5-dehydrogenase (EC [uncultured Paraburkholderia sp.]